MSTRRLNYTIAIAIGIAVGVLLGLSVNRGQLSVDDDTWVVPVIVVD